MIFQKVREAERENVFAEYNQRDRRGRQRHGQALRERRHHRRDRPRSRRVLPRKEQSRAESYTPGDRVRAVIKGVNRSAKGPQIVLSRTDPALLIKLFEQEVPEIYDGTVMIRGAVREAGDRAKVAVFSRERDVDPVGACVGMKGTRVQSIIRELRGEKIDIVEWSEDPIAFVTNALSPAKVQRVSIVDDARARDGSRRRGQAAVAGHRQEGPERPARREADRLAHRHQERGREAPRGRGAVRRARESADASAAGEERRRGGRRRRTADTRRGAASAKTREAGRAVCPTDSRRQAPASSRPRCPAPAEAARRLAATAARPERRGDARQTALERQRHLEVPTLATVRIYKVAELLEHHEPGSDGAAQARSRHRGEERVEHDRRGRGAAVRRRAWRGSATSRCRRATSFADTPAPSRARSPAGKRARAAQAGGAGAAAAAPRQERPSRSSIRPRLPRPRPSSSCRSAKTCSRSRSHSRSPSLSRSPRPTSKPRRRPSSAAGAAVDPAPPVAAAPSARRSRRQPRASASAARSQEPRQLARPKPAAGSQAPTGNLARPQAPPRAAGAAAGAALGAATARPAASCRRRCGCASRIRGPARRRRRRRAGRMLVPSAGSQRRRPRRRRRPEI